MKILSALIFISVVFAVGAKAQLCGTYTTSVTVADEAGKPVDNAEVKIVPLQKKNDARGKSFLREREYPSRHLISFNEGEPVKGNYKILVSANGFLPAEKVISFPHCQSQSFQFRLKTSGLIFQPPLTRVKPEELTEKQNVSRICGTVMDKMRAILPGVTIKAKSYKKGTFKTTTDAEGNFDLEIPDGLYKIIMKKSGFKKVVMKNQSLPYETRSCRNFILISTVKGHQIT